MIDYSLPGKIKTTYKNNLPFPNIVIDDFLPEFLLESVLQEIESHNEWYHNLEKWIEEFEVNKFYYPNHDTDMTELKNKIPITKFLFDYLNSPKFIKFLEDLTGIENLSTDPILLGGGIHKIGTGGKLAIHKDFNAHPGTFKSRKLNLLIYLNKNWKKEWEGNLELVSEKTREKNLEIEPIFNRAVIFNIEDALHGHSVPLNTPPNIFRYSLALYYFTEEIPEEKHNVFFYRDEEIKDTKKTMIDLSISKKLKTQYKKEFPFPHTIIDEFVYPPLLEKVWNEMKSFEYFGWDGSSYSAEHQVNKFFTPWCENNINDIRIAAPSTFYMMEYFNSAEFISFVEELTGIGNLIPDPTWFGGAVHKIGRGGKLDVHADYTKHRHLEMYRRLTMLIYMNKDWDLKWGGNLELWDKEMKFCVKEIEPIFNRMVIFDVTHDSFHGHPKPLGCPEDVNRYSFSICYFTKEKNYSLQDELSATWQITPSLTEKNK